MSGFMSKNSFLSFLQGFNRAGRGGPARLLTIAGVGVSMAALAIGASSITHPAAPESSVAKMPDVDPLPGGMQSNAAQDALLLRHAQDKARQALANGESYTPPMPASVPLKIVDKPAAVETAKAEPPPPPAIVPVPEPPPP
jgi:intracellular multiplication protein IcmE